MFVIIFLSPVLVLFFLPVLLHFCFVLLKKERLAVQKYIHFRRSRIIIITATREMSRIQSSLYIQRRSLDVLNKSLINPRDVFILNYVAQTVWPSSDLKTSRGDLLDDLYIFLALNAMSMGWIWDAKLHLISSVKDVRVISKEGKRRSAGHPECPAVCI